MKISEFAGMNAKMEHLMRSAQAGRIVHAMMFTGPHGTGKKSMAQIFARAALCHGEGAQKPCDACASCKKCLNDSHPDVHFLAPEKSTIRVNAIRALIDALSLASYEGGRKVAIIDRADCMNESAQNALLKTLENPVGDTMFLLLTDRPSSLLPTIVSRCLQVRFQALEPQECERVLLKRGVSPERAPVLAALAQGSVGRALEMDRDEGFFALRERVISALEGRIAPDAIAHITAEIGDVKGREGDVLEIIEQWARDLMRVQNGAEPLDRSQKARMLACEESGSALMQRVIFARKQLNANLSWVNVLESMNFARACGKT